MLQERRGKKDAIWIVVSAEDTQGEANEVNATGCQELCEARIDAQADMLYGDLFTQAKELEKANPHLHPFVEEICQLAKGFKVRKLEEFVKQYIV